MDITEKVEAAAGSLIKWWSERRDRLSLRLLNFPATGATASGGIHTHVTNVSI